MSTAFYVSYAALWVLVLVLIGLVLAIYRHFGVQSLGTLEGVQRDGLPVGAKVESFAGVTPGGDVVVWAPTPGRSTMLVFATPDCEPCRVVLPELSRLAADAAARDLPFEVVVVVPGPADQAARVLELGEAFTVLGDHGGPLFDTWKVRGTPFGFAIGPDGRVKAKNVVSSDTRIENTLKAAGMTDVAALVGVAS